MCHGVWLRCLGPALRGAAAKRTCIRSAKSAAGIMPSRRRATSSSISAPRAWTCASNWRHRSWRGSAGQSPRWTRCTASRYFDDRDLIGFVDGTENPADQAAIDATIIGEEDAAFAGGSYVIVQKYLHDLQGWNALPIEAQERIIGRTKLADIELDDAVKPTSAHNALTTIIEDGKQLEILRDNMPFGDVGKGEFGTYFIGYARSPHRIEQMLENMFVGRPPGNYDRLLDFSRAVTGTLSLCRRRRSWKTLPPRTRLRHRPVRPPTDAERTRSCGRRRLMVRSASVHLRGRVRP